ncbi:E3 ubiquitin-protein ligase TRIM35-like [Alosa sapidissima]|uniref:E3 ubiquitin-protein ligase TRIM35-like n=1 Tax=Alosa sapidissima TaxID=34773 RepID=UPI001C0803A4|nr:E3 ubiquitin-protein ligase TRIM35-like [Alosa sapidissima]XP_041966899.1 E3 ubiquitin-protein ligase TRIM35-like [Alosa sapidissima]XP_041966900.1 E3 ubiquitin-protein ligase TRIM35-like [Alosa sapidissima]
MAENMEDFEYYLSCQICFSTVEEPVSLECNHSFCKRCVCEFWDQDEKRFCPVCQMPAPKDTPEVNVTLKNLADTFAGRIQGDSNSETNEEGLCCVHSLKPTMICMTDREVICTECESVKEHIEKVIRLKDMAADTRQSISLNLIKMKQQLEDCNDVEDTYMIMRKHTMVQHDEVEKKIKEEFLQLHRFLREEEEARLAAVKEEAERNQMTIERELKIVRGQIHALTEAIQCSQKDLIKDDVTIFQDSSRIKARARNTLMGPNVVSGAVMDIAGHLGNLKFKVWKKMMETVEYYPVILDPNTADGWLSVSEDMTSVTEIRNKQIVPDNPERFTRYIYVLGSEGYDSGQHCWEVEVGDRDRWSLGVAYKSIERKEETFLEPKFGFWTLWMTEDNYTVGAVPCFPDNKPKKVRIELDCDKGHLSFYDVTDDMPMTLIHTFFHAFTETLYPFFSTETDDSKIGIQVSPFNLSWVATPSHKTENKEKTEIKT